MEVRLPVTTICYLFLYFAELGHRGSLKPATYFAPRVAIYFGIFMTPLRPLTYPDSSMSRFRSTLLGSPLEA
jgi:hypothetical protein